jgi:hypothetical protein
MPCMSRNVRCRAFTRRRKYVLASGAPSARTHPTLSEFSYIGQSRGEGKPLRRWRKRRLRRERDILHASDLLAFFSCLWTLVLSTCPNAQTNLKRREGTYTEACISPPFFGARQNLASERKKATTEELTFRYNPSRRQSQMPDVQLIGEVLPRNGRKS